jgi:hypothetical protein
VRSPQQSPRGRARPCEPKPLWGSRQPDGNTPQRTVGRRRRRLLWRKALARLDSRPWRPTATKPQSEGQLDSCERQPHSYAPWTIGGNHRFSTTALRCKSEIRSRSNAQKPSRTSLKGRFRRGSIGEDSQGGREDERPEGGIDACFGEWRRSVRPKQQDPPVLPVNPQSGL